MLDLDSGGNHPRGAKALASCIEMNNQKSRLREVSHVDRQSGLSDSVVQSTIPEPVSETHNVS